MAGKGPPLALKRSLKLPLVAFYGLGTILGAGIYVLVGKVAAHAGLLAPLSFLVAAAIATLCALSYAELVSRFPKSAGEAVYVEAAFHRPSLSLLIGLMIVAIGLVSTATLVKGLLGYVHTFFALPDTLVIIATVLVIGLIVSWGIGESVMIAASMTALKMRGLIIITLLVFAAINLALWVIKGRRREPAPFNIPRWVPLTGLVASLGSVAVQLVGLL